MATGNPYRHAHGIAQVKSAARRQSFEETVAEERPLPTSVSKVLGKLKKAGVAERKIVQLEKSERILQSLRPEHPRSSRIQHTPRRKSSQNGSTTSPEVSCPRQSPNQKTSSKSTSEPCATCFEKEEIVEPITQPNSECQSEDELEPPCASIADSALTKSVRLLEELKLFDLSEDHTKDDAGRMRADSFATDPGAAMQASPSCTPRDGPSCTPRDKAESVALIKERIDLLIDLLQQPGQQKLSSQRDAVIDELRAAIHEHTRQRGTSIDGAQSCAEQLQMCGVSSPASPASTLTRTPSDVWSDRSPGGSPGCSTALESPYLGSPASTLRAALFEDKLNGTQGRGAVSQSPLEQSLLLRRQEESSSLPNSPGAFTRRASFPPPALKVSSRTLKSKASANSGMPFSPRRLVCTNVKITRTWKYE